MTVISPTIAEGLRDLLAQGSIRHVERAYEWGDLVDCELVFAATDDPEINAAAFREARSRRIWINSADDPAHCDFILPGVIRRGDLAVARAFDNRIGTFAVAEALRLLKESRAKLNAEVCAVSNVQEEVGLLGARQIAYSLKPDVAVVVDVTHATDYPNVNKPQHGDVKVGKGPTLTHGGCNHPEVVARLEGLAQKNKIPLQHEAMSNTSGTDTDVIFWTRGGIASALISLPNRYMHSPVEVVSLKDLQYIPELLAALGASGCLGAVEMVPGANPSLRSIPSRAASAAGLARAWLISSSMY